MDVESWSARELQTLLGYTQWRNYENTIEKAEESCKNAGQTVHPSLEKYNKRPAPSDRLQGAGAIFLCSSVNCSAALRNKLLNIHIAIKIINEKIVQLYYYNYF